jgi:hypothetical protein
MTDGLGRRDPGFGGPFGPEAAPAPPAGATRCWYSVLINMRVFTCDAATAASQCLIGGPGNGLICAPASGAAVSPCLRSAWPETVPSHRGHEC